MTETLDRRTYSVAEAARLAGCSRGVMYEMVRLGQVPGVLRLGPRRIVLSRVALDRWLAGEMSEENGHIARDE